MTTPTKVPLTHRLRELPRVYLFAVALAILLPAAAALVFFYYVQTYHFETVDPGKLYRTGLRSHREFATTLNSFGHKKPTVVSLVDGDESKKPPFESERTVLLRAKFRYRHIPIPLGGWPTTEQVRAFLNLTTDKYHPVLVHCAQGVRRTGMLVAAYQLSVLKWDKQKTKDAIITFGHSRRSIGDIERFIDIYDPDSRTVTESPTPTGSE